MLAMWFIMMIGMMTPSAAPMILIYARVGRQAAVQGKPYAASAWFAAGYLLAWGVFSIAATLTQWTLECAALLTPMMESASQVLGGVLLIAAGIYQWTLKAACLSHCQAPLNFIMQHLIARIAPRPLLHRLLLGAHGVTVVSGVMNLLWITALAILVLAEKVLPLGASLHALPESAS